MERFLDEISRNLLSYKRNDFDICVYITVLDNNPILKADLTVLHRNLSTYVYMKECDDVIKTLGRVDGLDEITTLLYAGLSNQFFFTRSPEGTFIFSDLLNDIYTQLQKEVEGCF